MPALTRRRSPDAREECAHVYYGDVRVGTIAMRTGAAWRGPVGLGLRFLPGAHPSECTDGTAEWQAGMEALILVATSGWPTMFARIGVMRASNRRVERVFGLSAPPALGPFLCPALWVGWKGASIGHFIGTDRDQNGWL
jgi:hypothetical protein